MDLAAFEKYPFLGILRGIGEDDLEPLTETIVSSALRNVEITMNTPNAASLIKKMVSLAAGRLSVGAGTVCDMEALKAALDAGASFIVSPILVTEVVATCVKRKLPVFPGALTPSEIYHAWKAGASMVKVFPVGMFGPGYLKEIKAPMSHIKLMACGGVTPDNLKAYFEAGASAVAFGSGVFREAWLKAKDFKSIGSQIRKFSLWRSGAAGRPAPLTPG